MDFGFTVKTQMKCLIMWHFFRVYTVYQNKNNLQREKYNFICFVCLIDLILYVPVNYFSTKSAMLRGVFLGSTSTKLGLMCLAQGHNTVTLVRLEPATLRSRVKHSTTEPLRSLQFYWKITTYDHLIYTKGHPNFIVSNQKDEPISAYR